MDTAQLFQLWTFHGDVLEYLDTDSEDAVLGLRHYQGACGCE